MKKLFFVLVLALTTVTAGAQHHHHDHNGPQGRPHDRHRIECATHDQMGMVMHTLDQQSFDDKKLEIAKLCVVLGHFCVDDLSRMAAVFSFDDSRLKFLTFAYDYCEDPEHYYDLREVFSFRSNFDTLMDSVRSGRQRR